MASRTEYCGRHAFAGFHEMTRHAALHQEPSHFRMTRARSFIMTALRSSDIPLSAEDLLRNLPGECHKTALSTVYRTLDTLAARGLVRRLTLVDGDCALFELVAGPHRHYAVCLGCHAFIPLDDCPVDKSVCATLSERGFDVTDHTLVLYGYCRACGKDNPSGRSRR